MAAGGKPETLRSSDAVFLNAPAYVIDPFKGAAHVKSTTGKSYARQALEIAQARFGAGKIRASEYYRFGIHNPAFCAADRRAFIGDEAKDELNRAMGTSPANQNALLHDKLLFSMIMRQNDIPTTHTQAFYSRNRRVVGMINLHSAAEIVDFIANKAKFPLFGKPNGRAFAIGTLSIFALSADKQKLTLGNGQIISLKDLSEDLAKNFGPGYFFQDHLVQHPIAMQACGTALGTLRVATLMHKKGPFPLYALHRIPGENAMSDSVHIKSRQNAEIDVKTGKIIQHFQADRTFGHPVQTARFSQQCYIGTQLPFWPEIIELVTRGHWLFSRNGCIGWDVALTVDGPVIVEAQGSPFHMGWQLASGRGLLNPEFARHFLEALKVVGYRRRSRLFRKLQAQAAQP